MKRYHESPIQIFKAVQECTDGDYALVHLFEDNLPYYNMFKDAVEQGRDVILDNSIFELGTAFNSDRFAYWVQQLKPTWYIVPDCWKSCDSTIEMFNDFIKKYPALPGKRIGVAQGNTIEEVTKCYQALEPSCDMIAFNLDFASESLLPVLGVPYCLRMSLGRRRVLGELYARGVINEAKPHHLLGCGVPQEVIWYPKAWEWLRSIDTCNPVIHGMEIIYYSVALPGLTFKTADKMCTRMHASVSDRAWHVIKTNIDAFRDYCLLRG